MAERFHHYIIYAKISPLNFRSSSNFKIFSTRLDEIRQNQELRDFVTRPITPLLYGKERYASDGAKIDAHVHFREISFTRFFVPIAALH